MYENTAVAFLYQFQQRTGLHVCSQSNRAESHSEAACVSNDAPTEKRNLLECFLLQNINPPLQLAYTCWLHCSEAAHTTVH